MATAGLVLAIFCVLGMLAGMVPFFGWINWFNIPLAFIALVGHLSRTWAFVAPTFRSASPAGKAALRGSAMATAVASDPLGLSGVGMMGASQDKPDRNKALAGIILAIAAIAFGGIRWALGGFLL